MKNIEKICIGEHEPIHDVIRIIEDGEAQIALVVDEALTLVGTVTDGDIRRGLLANYPLDTPVKRIMFKEFTTVDENVSKDDALTLMKTKVLHQIPVVNSEKKVIGIYLLDELLAPSHNSNIVVLMAGGLGKRLMPLTDDCPKPMLKVGNKPLLENIVENFADQGFEKFYISVNYKKESIKEYFENGEKWDVSIEYLDEDAHLGTAGSLSLLPNMPDEPVIVMNADILTRIDFRSLLDFHKKNNSAGTMCVRDYTYQIPYGVVKTEDELIIDCEEKPLHKYFINAGIYVLEPLALNQIVLNKKIDMPEIFLKLLEAGHATKVFPIHEYWLDIGHQEDYARANGEFYEFFNSYKVSDE